MEKILERLEKIEAFIFQKGDEEFLTIEDVERITGLKKNTIYAYHKSKDLPSYKFGDRLLRFKKREVIEWMCNRIIQN